MKKWILLCLVIIFAVWGVCHFLPGFSFAHILPEHLRESTAIKILFFIGLMWIVLGAGFFIHFCWFASRAIRIEGKVTSFATQTEKGREMYAEVVTYYLGDKPRTVTGAVWTPFMPATLHKMRIVWVNRDDWDKAVMYSPLVFFAFGLFLMLGFVVCAVIFTIA